MSLPLYTNSLRSNRITVLCCSVGLMLFALLFASLFKQYTSQIDELVANMPAGFEAVLGDFALAASPAGWINLELYSLFVPMILSIVGVTLGAALIGKEESRGTLELLLASPISRSQIMLQKYVAAITKLAIIALGPWIGVALGTLLFDFDVSLVHVLLASFSGLLLGLSFATITIAVQALTGKRSIALGVGSGLLVITYLCNILSQISHSLSFLKYLSPFYYFNVTDILTGHPSIGYFSVLLGVVLIACCTALVAFNSRDTGV